MRVSTPLAAVLAALAVSSGAWAEDVTRGSSPEARAPVVINADGAAADAGEQKPAYDSSAEADAGRDGPADQASEDSDLRAASAAARGADKHGGRKATATTIEPAAKSEAPGKPLQPVAGAPEDTDKREQAAEDAAMKEAEAVSAEHEKKAAETAKEAPAAPLEPTLSINVDLAEQRMTVAENGETLYTWPVSSGRSGYETPTGEFKPVWMTKMWYSRQYDYAPMPNAIFFHGGAAIHATNATGALGRPASHGCVRLSPGNASKLFKLVSRHGKDRTEIVVHGTPNFAREVAGGGSRSGRRYYESYDGYYGYGYGSGYYYGNYGYAPGYRNRYSRYDGYYGQRQRRAYSYEGRAPRYQPRGLFSSNGY